MVYKTPERYIKIKKELLKDIYKELKNKSSLTYKDISNEIGTNFDKIILRGDLLSEKCFRRLKKLIIRELGNAFLSNFIKNGDLPHKTIIGRGGSEEIILKEDDKNAEFVGIMLGDGTLYNNGNVVSVSLNGVDEEDYVKYVKKLMSDIIKNFEIHEIWERNKFPKYKHKKGIELSIFSQAVHYSLVSIGLVPGDKVENQVKIPDWIYKRDSFKIACLKGLFDTDGSIFINKRNRSFVLNFTSSSKPLVQDFYKLCNSLNIKPISKIYDGLNNSKIETNKREVIRKFLNIVNPEKMKETYKKKYLGINLIYLNTSEKIIKEINDKIKKDYPNEYNRRYSKEFALYLKKICEKIFSKNKIDEIHGHKYTSEVSDEMIDTAIEKALKFKYRRYNKHYVKNLKHLFEKLGSYLFVIEYLKEHDERPILFEEKIRNHLRQHFIEENISYEKWLKKYKIKKILIDKNNNEVLEFPLKLRRIVCQQIFKILNNIDLKKTDNQVLKELIVRFNELDILLLTWLLDKPHYKQALTKYFIDFIRLIRKINELYNLKESYSAHSIANDSNLDISLSYNSIKDILSDLKEYYQNYYNE